eukprot:TRINITY_DN23563_c0_g1_i1.p2 TRINITY_DN23563_c0_g1~~TRINITY_DN23563_c0_g1_i1.p2  ORF type:complete len:104 (+),score=21.21 TRINITY_DN23563_c0_g1_i1:46-357(+)
MQEVLAAKNAGKKKKKDVAGIKIAIIEVGCGTSEHSIRLEVDEDKQVWKCRSGEWKMGFSISLENSTLIRINPIKSECIVPKGHISVMTGAAQALRMLKNHIL